MVAQQLDVAAALTEDCRQGIVADETERTYTDISCLAYEMQPAVCVEDFERQRKHVTKHVIETGGRTWHLPYL